MSDEVTQGLVPSENARDQRYHNYIVTLKRRGELPVALEQEYEKVMEWERIGKVDPIPEDRVAKGDTGTTKPINIRHKTLS